MALPEVGPAAMLSDGRQVAAPLAKISCLSCGCVSHRAPQSKDTVRTAFGDDYSLSHALDAPGLRRGSAYAEFILDAIALPVRARVLDVGCGSGALLHGIADRRPDVDLAGVEAASQAATAATGDRRIVIAQAFAEDLPRPDQPFDLVCSINVVEHSFEPGAFLRALALQAAPGGTVAVVCPRADEPNLELLFCDHVHTLTAAMLAALGRRCGLDLVAAYPAPDHIGDFQLCVFTKGTANAPIRPAAVATDRLAEERHAYLQAWSRLDDDLEAAMRDGEASAAFGAAEAAALLRAYAPRAWNRTTALLVDDPHSAWDLGRPVHRYEAHHGRDAGGILVAVHPARQSAVGQRLARDGHRPVLWPDAIRR